ncbi:MAG TPA: sarcosine oxidase subunit delta [Steroidobacteraceae bacterium]|nr:sarcosine oxidase subunit delta [Gammaproteobacteria bacterium]HEV2284672.1 sarcosine oxidase subunit delta [Steroidobacteraceae bacterium]
MMLITCPDCGPRDEAEFVCGGATHIVRPPLTASDAEWGEYLFYRDNPRGLLRERWRHAYGCGQWFNVARHTVTHAIVAVYRMTETPGGAGA